MDGVGQKLTQTTANTAGFYTHVIESFFFDGAKNSNMWKVKMLYEREYSMI